MTKAKPEPFEEEFNKGLTSLVVLAVRRLVVEL